MTLQEWTATIVAELRAEGFDVSEYWGFPLVKRPTVFEDGVRLLKLKLSLAAERTIYAQGMLYLPIGSAALRREHEAEDAMATPDWTKLSARSSFSVRIDPTPGAPSAITVRNARADRPGWFEWKAAHRVEREVLEPGAARLVPMPFTGAIELTLGFGVVLE